MIQTIEWQEKVVRILDQTALPQEVRYLDCSDYHEVAKAIVRMNIRGAPAIGIAAALGLALGVQGIDSTKKNEFLDKMGTIEQEFLKTRPTAVNLAWAVKRLREVAYKQSGNIEEIKETIKSEALKILAEDIATNKAIGQHGVSLVPNQAQILTHCNAGALATGGYGTALGVIRAAHEYGKNIHVYVDETRPFLQGSRLTAWELMEEKIPITLITDNMAGYFMYQGQIDLVIVGADRVAANGDVANKIGTYSLAVLAKAHNLPFYVAAPTSTLDLTMTSGRKIPIEERDPGEVTSLAGYRCAPDGVRAANPAFDITPHEYIKAIITEKGIICAPYPENLRKVLA